MQTLATLCASIAVWQQRSLRVRRRIASDAMIALDGIEPSNDPPHRARPSAPEPSPKPTLVVTHRTRCRYAAPIAPGPHRLMLRPRESVALSALSARLTVTRRARLTHAQDVQGDGVIEARFDGSSDSLTIDSAARLDLDASAWPVFAIAAAAQTHPFAYSPDDAADLGALPAPQFPDPEGRLTRWAQGFSLGRRTGTLSLLKDIRRGNDGGIACRLREAEGVQAPLETPGAGQRLLPRSGGADGGGRAPARSRRGWCRAACSTPTGACSAPVAPVRRTPGC